MGSVEPLTPPVSPLAVRAPSDDHDYKLPRGGRESIRLTAQHHTLRERQGWLLHPHVAQALETIAQPQIADVATGTGIWAMEVARQYPRADVLGLDVSDLQFSPPCTLSRNMSFDLSDILEEAPARYQGKFDLVHVRLLLCAGPAADKQRFISYLRALLKPGGWLQWEDLAFPNLHACQPSDSPGGSVPIISLADHPVMTANEKHLAMRQKAEWFNHFEDVMREAGGFERVEKISPPPVPHLLQIESELAVAVQTEIFEMALNKKKIADPADSRASTDLRNAVEALHADARAGLLFSYAWNVGIARKV